MSNDEQTHTGRANIGVVGLAVMGANLARGQDWGPMRITKLLTRGNYGITPEEGAEPVIHLAGPTAIAAPSGTYFHQLKPFGKEGPRATDESWRRFPGDLSLPGSGYARASSSSAAWAKRSPTIRWNSVASSRSSCGDQCARAICMPR